MAGVAAGGVPDPRAAAISIKRRVKEGSPASEFTSKKFILIPRCHLIPRRPGAILDHLAQGCRPLSLTREE